MTQTSILTLAVRLRRKITTVSPDGSRLTFRAKVALKSVRCQRSIAELVTWHWVPPSLMTQ